MTGGGSFHFRYPRIAAYALLYVAFPVWLVLTAAVLVGGMYSIGVTIWMRLYSNILPSLVFVPLSGFCIYIGWRLIKTKAALFSDYLVDGSGVRVQSSAGDATQLRWGDISCAYVRSFAAELELISPRLSAPIYLTAMGLNWTAPGIPRTQLNLAAACVKDHVMCPVVELRF